MILDIEKIETILAFSIKKNTSNMCYLEEKLHSNRIFQKRYDSITDFEDSRAFLIFEIKNSMLKGFCLKLCAPRDKASFLTLVSALAKIRSQ